MAEQGTEFREETASVGLLIKRLGATVGIQANCDLGHTHTLTHTLNLPEWLNLHPRLISPSNVSHSTPLVLKASVIRSALISLTEEWVTPQTHLLSAIKLVSIKERSGEEDRMWNRRGDEKKRWEVGARERRKEYGAEEWRHKQEKREMDGSSRSRKAG